MCQKRQNLSLIAQCVLGVFYISHTLEIACNGETDEFGIRARFGFTDHRRQGDIHHGFPDRDNVGQQPMRQFQPNRYNNMRNQWSHEDEHEWLDYCCPLVTCAAAYGATGSVVTAVMTPVCLSVG